LNLLHHDNGHLRSIILPILDGPLSNNNTTSLDEQSNPCESTISINTTSVIPSQQILANSLQFYSSRSPSPQMDIGGYLLPDRNTSMLMYHYTKHVAELLQPVLHPRNPWRTTYFQFALQGCPDFATCDSSGPALKVSTAIFHSVLSSAAFHLRNATGGSTRFHKLGLRHRAKSLQALNSALLGPWDSKLYTAYLTAMLSLVTIDVSIITCKASAFELHLTSQPRL
jgi:arginine metabolism regulation protein II